MVKGEGVRQLGQCLAEWRCEMRKYAKWRMQNADGDGSGNGDEAGKVTLVLELVLVSGLGLGLGQTKGSKKSQLERATRAIE